MPKFRIIPRLEIKSGHVIKGMKMEGLKIIGKPEDLSLRFNQEGADEIMYDDIVASLYNRDLDFKNLKKVSNQIDIPLIVSGGIKSKNYSRKAFRYGADKICLNTSIFKKKKFVKELISIYGSQSISSQVQTKKIGDSYEVFSESGRERMYIKLFDWLQILQDLNFGEIYLIFIDNDGIKEMPNFELLKKCRSLVKIPLIYGGGVKNLNDLKDLKKIDYNGVILSSALYSGEISLKTLKI